MRVDDGYKEILLDGVSERVHFELPVIIKRDFMHGPADGLWKELPCGSPVSSDFARILKCFRRLRRPWFMVHLVMILGMRRWPCEGVCRRLLKGIARLNAISQKR